MLISAFATFLIAQQAFAKAVTAPLAPDQGLINPAAVTTRTFKSFSANLGRQQEVTEATQLQDSALTTTIVVNSLDVHLIWDFKPLFFEIDLLPQKGEKKTDNTYSGSGGSSQSHSKDSLTLIPLQAIAALRLGNYGSIGVKSLTTVAKVDVTQRYQSTQDGFSSSVDERNQLDTQFKVFGAGATLNLFNTGLYAAYSAEFTDLKITQDFLGSNARTIGNSSYVVVSDYEKTQTRKVRRDVYGVGYLKKFSRNTVRLEASYEKIPPLSDSTNLKDGEMYRYIGETIWSYFHLGCEWRQIKGYYVDAYNLIPYYFNFAQFTNSTRNEYGVFGGLRSSKGHSVGASFFISTNEDKQRFSATDTNEYKARQTTTSMSLSYTYLF